ncbi:low temperature requirement protein A [Microbacterium lacus]|uniref:low temperature requirement protein A n=1 Tax=Microbacterium lacus TaxID=415217 RepID=UPI003850D25E
MSLNHSLTRMVGRDPHQHHRSATPLELLFDLTFVIAFSQAGTQAAHLLELGHLGNAVIGFIVAMFATTWAWINYSWLASAYDNDDIFFRVATLVQMVGVLIMALGFPSFFHSIEEGVYLDNSIMIAGYIVMRVSAIALWLRVASHDPQRRRTAMTYAIGLAIVQMGWVVVFFARQSIVVGLTFMVVLGVLEMLIPVFAERRGETPWHPHHIAERYGLIVIITLGEVLLGTILAVSAVVESEGWSIQAVLVAFGGTVLAFAMWWVYFVLPSGQILHRHRERAFGWGYGHMLLLASIAGVGAGLHVAAYVISDEAHVDATFALLCVAVPVLVFEFSLLALYTLLVREFDPFHFWLFLGSVGVLGVSVIAVLSGATIGVALVILACSPIVIVVGYELVGHRHEMDVLQRDAARG